MADQTPSSTMPKIEVLDRIQSIPMVHSAIEKTNSTYTYLKDSHHLISWALGYAEAGLNYATATAGPIASPIAKKFESQINAVDQKLCEGLTMVQEKVPIVKEPPEQVYEAAKRVMSSSLQPSIDKFSAARETATQQATTKANEILSTHYGEIALQGVDNTSALVNRFLDYYFPHVGEEGEQPAPVSADENKVLHAVQTIGQLSTKTAYRVYHSVAAQLKTIKKEDVSDYISRVVSILHLTNFLNVEQKQICDEKQNSETNEKPEQMNQN